ncbi:MAG: hypothetical protein IPK80_34085 [Nannocystis sp.]|nr:hypothetical protein [Nannocystis sp.]
MGSPEFDLRVDYQATSADFWRIVDEHAPVILLTTSRGGKIGWEIEAIEGGHGLNNPGDPAMDWASDKHGDDQFPTEATIEARSWEAITSYRQGKTLPSRLPIDAIMAATTALGLTNVAIDDGGTSGNFPVGLPRPARALLRPSGAPQRGRGAYPCRPGAAGRRRERAARGDAGRSAARAPSGERRVPVSAGLRRLAVRGRRRAS